MNASKPCEKRCSLCRKKSVIIYIAGSLSFPVRFDKGRITVSLKRKKKKDRKIRRKQKKETYDSFQLREQISIVAKISRSTFP